MTPRRDEQGFTLIELLVSVVILGVIAGPLAASIIVTFTDTATKLRVSESHDRQLAGVYWGPDVASTDSFRTTTACTVPSGTLLVGLSWTDDRGLNKVDYVLDSSTSPKTLYRYKCIGTGTTSRVTVAHQVESASCSPACGSLDATTRSVQLVLNEANSTITLDGTRRATP